MKVPQFFRQLRLLGLALLCLLLAAPAFAKDEDIRLEEAKRWSDKGEYDKAVQELRMYLSEHPDATDIYARIGSLRFKQGNFKLAGENYKLALAKNPGLSEARQGLAESYEKGGDKARAAEQWQQLAQASKDPAQKKMAATRAAALAHEAGPSASAHPSPPSANAQTVAAAKPAESAPSNEKHAPAAAAAKPVAAAKPAGESSPGYSPALDSSSSQGAQGIYAEKDFQDAMRAYREKKPDAALASLRKCLSKTPNHPGAYYLGGVIRYERGELGKAAYNFKRSTDYPDRGYNAYFYLGRIYQKQERYPEAVKAYEKYLPLSQSEAGKHQVEGYLAQMRGGKENGKAPQGREAEKAKAAQAKPEAGEKADATSEKSGGEGAESDQAAADSAKARKKKPTSLEEVAAAAKALQPQGPAQVLGQNGSFFFIIPDAGSASGKNLSEAYELCRREKFEKAVTALQETAMTYGGTDNALAAKLDLASVYMRLGLWKNAADQLADFTAAKDSSKFSDAVSYLSALAHLGLKEGDAAEKALLKIHPGAAFGPTQEEIDFRLAQSGEMLKDSKKWSLYLERAFASSKEPLRKAQMAQQLGFLHAKFGSSDKAAEYFKRSMADCRDSALADLCAESQLRLADMAFRKKDWKDAMGQYRIFAGKFPNHKESAWVHYQMANIYKATNNFESALNEYKRVIDNYPDSYWASQAKWKREDTIWQKEYEEVLD